MTSPGEGLVAILRSEMKDSEIEQTNPELVAFRPLRVFHQQKTVMNDQI
jgi:hypothetical protein